MGEPRDFRTEFKPTADEYRRVSKILMMGFLLCIPFAILLWKVPGYRTLGIAGLALCIAAPIIGSLVWLPKLICPGCQKKMDQSPGFLGRSGLGDFCPECGAASVEKGWFFPKCTSCGKTLSQGRNGRQFKIRYCTWCDARVDDAGL
jgi:hypothetical protein